MISEKHLKHFGKSLLVFLTEGLFQIVNIESNIFNQESAFHVDFVNNKTQLTVVNNQKMYNLFQTVLYKKKLKEQKEKAAVK